MIWLVHLILELSERDVFCTTFMCPLHQSKNSISFTIANCCHRLQSHSEQELMLNVCLILLEDSCFLCIKTVMHKEKLSLTAGKMGIKYRYNSEALLCFPNKNFQ